MRNAFCFGHRNDALGARDVCGGIKRQTRIHLHRHTPRDDAHNLAAKAHNEAINQLIHWRIRMCGFHLRDEWRVFRLLHRLQNQRRIGRRILRLKLRELFEIAGIGNDGGELFESVELVHVE